MSRIRWSIGVGIAGIAGLVVGCFALGSRLPDAVERAFHPRSVQSVVLYSLEPSSPNGNAKPDARAFHGHAILGELPINDPAQRKKLFAAFRRGVADHDGTLAACFTPRHGLRIVREKTTLDLVICFQCSQVKVYENGVPSETILISTSPRTLFNDTLLDAGIPLAQGAQ